MNPTAPPAEANADAPGRVNLLGEHTDYNDGFVLPVAIPQRTRVRMRRVAGPGFLVESSLMGRPARFTLEQPAQEQFARYVQGCLLVAREHGAAIPPLAIAVDSEVPMGVGLSSSAALEVAVLRCLRALLDLPLDDLLIARLAQRAEVEHAGVRCGIMDQMAASLATTASALFVDTRSLACKSVPLPGGTAVLVVDSGVGRSLATSGYNERRAECEEAARQLGCRSLRDVADPAQLQGLRSPLRERARHVLSENARVLRAAAGVDAAEFGRLMNASHDSLRDDFAVSTPELDRLVELLRDARGVHGARLTGAGFGGACVALCTPAHLQAAAEQVLARYAAPGRQGRLLVPPP